uniref:Uncharacterized protein n=1 Tax=Brugia timori TaxID=42155 RepID=A0A0R3Q4J9_9BILA
MLPSNLQVLRDKKSDWSLAVFFLCGVLEEIRSSITLKINNVSDAVQENSLKIANACVQASNLNNRLSLFSADQFIENVSLFAHSTSIYRKIFFSCILIIHIAERNGRFILNPI